MAKPSIRKASGIKGPMSGTATASMASQRSVIGVGKHQRRERSGSLEEREGNDNLGSLVFWRFEHSQNEFAMSAPIPFTPFQQRQLAARASRW